MGFNDELPPHIPVHVVPMCNLLVVTSCILWTACYALYVRESLRSKSAGMPLFAIARNFAWEFVYLVYVVESSLERMILMVWLFIDCCMVCGAIRYAKYDWSHSPWVARNIVFVFTAMTSAAAIGHWPFAKW